MTQTMKRYLVPTDGPDVDGFKRGLAQAFVMAKENSSKRILLLTPTKKQLERGTIVDSIGQSNAKMLLRNEPVSLPEGVTLTHGTEQTIRGASTNAVILVVYGRSSLLDKADEAHGANGIIVVPWAKDDVTEWAQAWNPGVVGESAAQSPQRTIENAVVERALELLTHSINLSSGIAHQSDREKAVQLLRMLRDEGEGFEPSAIRAWAVQHGWSATSANELREVAQAIVDRRPIRGGKERRWKSDLIERLREEVKQTDRG